MHMVNTTRARVYNHFNANMVHFKCTASALCVTLSSDSTVHARIESQHVISNNVAF